MDMNKEIIELYKKRADKIKTPSHKRTKVDIKADNNVNNDRHEFESIVPQTKFSQLYGIDDSKAKIIKIVDKFTRSLNGKASGTCQPALVCGSRGLGKTAIIEAAANHANLSLVTIPIERLVVRTRDDFLTSIEQLVLHCIQQQPTLVVLDRIDKVGDKEEYKYFIRESLEKLLKEENRILVFCTAYSLIDTTLGHDFRLTIHLKRPDMDARYQILRDMRDKNKFINQLNNDALRDIAINTPSFTALDLINMIDIAEIGSNGFPDLKNCHEAIDLVKQSFKRNTHLIGERPTIRWDDIGGLPDIRRAFADLMRQLEKDNLNCKFAGIALYGPPGCGKTMVAQAMANEAKLNFISVSPAELIDKYLGETEKNIRRVFSEAKEHEPCMIYFDEFDGLCGRRGKKENMTSAIHTLLAAMDGFVSRGKVVIVASTNRLEDIDPAMLRPGRLSKHLYVGPPNRSARFEILRILTSRSSCKLSSDVDLEYWADRTEHFTGAELDSLFSEAESKASSENEASTRSMNKPSDVELKNDHFVFALDRVRQENRQMMKKINED